MFIKCRKWTRFTSERNFFWTNLIDSHFMMFGLTENIAVFVMHINEHSLFFRVFFRHTQFDYYFFVLFRCYWTGSMHWSTESFWWYWMSQISIILWMIFFDFFFFGKFDSSDFIAWCSIHCFFSIEWCFFYSIR